MYNATESGRVGADDCRRGRWDAQSVSLSDDPMAIQYPDSLVSGLKTVAVGRLPRPLLFVLVDTGFTSGSKKMEEILLVTTVACSHFMPKTPQHLQQNCTWQ